MDRILRRQRLQSRKRKRKQVRCLQLFLLLVFPILGQAQHEPSPWQEKMESFKIQPVIALQIWTTYTMGQDVFNSTTGHYDAIDNRLNTQLRRSRLGVKGQPYEDLQFSFVAAMDLVGRDVLAGTEAGANNGASPNFRLWNASVQWRLYSGKEHLHLIAGYFPVQFGRESMTSAFRSTSLEKAWSQNYLRRHLTGIGPGRAPGLLLGGLIHQEDRAVHFSYSTGIYNPLYESLAGNSVGQSFAPLLTGRFVMHLGDPEFRKYTISHKVNTFGKRKGLSVALAGAYQGATDLFESSSAAGIDLLFNWGPFNVDGDWTLLRRSGTGSTVPASTGYLRMSYNLYLPNGLVVEPVAMVMRFQGEMGSSGQDHAARLQVLAGEENTIDLGTNLYFNPDLKMSFHYTFRNADPGAAGMGATVNNYFFQGGVGAIRRGDWLGMGLVAIF